MKYDQVEDNEWVRPKRRGYKMMCCDCGLVHEMDFKIIKQGNRSIIQFRARRNQRSTGQARRKNNEKRFSRDSSNSG